MGLFRFRKKQKEENKKKSSTEFLVTVYKIIHDTYDGVIISFDLSDIEFNHIPGQYINITANINNEKIIRSYSLCSSCGANYPSIGVKKIEGGKMSTYLKDELKEGDKITISKPQGNFKLENNSTGNQLGIVAGSGITPVLSMIESTIKTSKWKLHYGNQTEKKILFKNRLSELKSENLETTHYLSQDDLAGYHQGRISKERIQYILENSDFDNLFLCGPENLIKTAIEVAEKLNINPSKIHYELFNTPVSLNSNKTTTNKSDFKGEADCKVFIDGDEFNIRLKSNETMLDAFEREGIDAPFSCKGAVCCTCRAKVTSGTANMIMNYSLGEDEVKDGYILTCQAKASSNSLTVDFDQ